MGDHRACYCAQRGEDDACATILANRLSDEACAHALILPRLSAHTFQQSCAMGWLQELVLTAVKIQRRRLKCVSLGC